MSRMATSEPDPLPGAEQQVGAAAEHLPDGPTRMAAAHGLMAAGCTLTIPRLERIPTEYRLLDGIEVAAKLAKRLYRRAWLNPRGGMKWDATHFVSSSRR